MDQNHDDGSYGKNAIMEKELMRGRDMANQLLEVLVHKSTIHHVGDNNKKEEKPSIMLLPFAEDLVRKVLKSFTNTLLLLNTTTNDNDNCSSEVVLVPAVTARDFSLSTMKNCCTKPTYEGIIDDESCKSFITTKNRRGCYKRKSSVPTWKKDSSILCEDGHAWRKYGQKKTSNSKYLRSYYKCTYKTEQGCQAIKQVQRIQDDPPIYRTTYYGHHTCKNTLNPEIKLEPASSFESSTLLSFSNSNNTLPNKHAQLLSPSSVSSSTRKEEHTEIITDGHIAPTQLSSSNDHLHNLLCDYELYFDY